MKINNKSVRGLWKYEAGLEFENGDLVLLGDQIYICKCNSGSVVSGINPSSDEGRKYFKMYPGNIVSSLDEYYDIVNHPEEAEDKYISSRVLNEVLQDMYFGLGENGIITSRVDYQDEKMNLVGQIRSLGTPENVLDAILTNPKLNNGSVMISKNFPEIKDLVISSKRYINSTTTSSGSSDVDTETGDWDGIEIRGSANIGTRTSDLASFTYLFYSGTVFLSDEEGDVTKVKITNSTLGYVLYPGADGKFSVSALPGNVLVFSLPGYKTKSFILNSIVRELEIILDPIIVDPENPEEAVYEDIEFSEGDDYVMLRQYTYRSGATGAYHRIQELVDPTYGDIKFRHAIRRGESWTIDSAGWKSCVTNYEAAVNDRISKLDSYLNEKKKEQSSSSEPGFVEFDLNRLPEDGIVSVEHTGHNMNMIDIEIGKEIISSTKYITILFREKLDDSYYNYSTTLPVYLSEQATGEIRDKYFLSEYVTASVYYVHTPFKYIITLESVRGGRIDFGDIDIYYRKYTNNTEQ